MESQAVDKIEYSKIESVVRVKNVDHWYLLQYLGILPNHQLIQIAGNHENFENKIDAPNG